MTGMDQVEVVERIKSISLKDFRGFAGSHKLDTDADIVLISGPNGFGKTSLLEALVLLMTGWYDADSKDALDLITRESSKEDQIGGSPKERFKLSAKVKRGNKEEEKINLSWSRTSDTKERMPMPEGIAPSSLYDDEYESQNLNARDLSARELNTRVCAFFQDRVDRLFDLAASGRTYRDVYEPLPRVVVLATKRMEEIEKALQDEPNAGRYAERPEKEQKDPDTGLADRWREIVDPLRQLQRLLPNWPPESALPDEIIDDEELDGLARSMIVALGKDAKEIRYEMLRNEFGSAVDDALDREIRRAKRDAGENTEETANLLANIKDIDKELEAIATKFPNLDEEVTRFDATRPDLPNALQVFQSLHENAARWAGNATDKESKTEDDPRTRCIRREFAEVDADEAGKRMEELGTWLNERCDIFRKRESLYTKKAKLDRLLRESLRSERLSELEKIKKRLSAEIKELNEAWGAKHAYTRHQLRKERRAQAIDLLKAAENAARLCSEVLAELSKPNDDLMKDLNQRINQVLNRFSMVGGIHPLRLERDEEASESAVQRRYAIKSRDGRSLRHLSTGQRAQCAVSVLVAQNLAVSDRLNHRAIFLDDVTTAYDLSNLTREAILWRQLAYGGTEEKHRRQIFISSHHEDMTNHLLDLLVPPPGRKMRMIRFEDWSIGRGPSFHLFSVDPSDKTPKDCLAAALGGL